jgi:hypothetical protein
MSYLGFRLCAFTAVVAVALLAGCRDRSRRSARQAQCRKPPGSQRTPIVAHRGFCLGRVAVFVNGVIPDGYGFAELPKGAPSFTRLSVDESLGFPGRLQWDGHYITWEGLNPGDVTISRLAVSGSSVSVVGTTRLEKITRHASESWLYNGKVLVPYNIVGSRRNVIGLWQYSKGGKPKHNIRQFGSFKKRTIDFQAVTVSVNPSRSRIRK